MTLDTRPANANPEIAEDLVQFITKRLAVLDTKHGGLNVYDLLSAYAGLVLSHIADCGPDHGPAILERYISLLQKQEVYAGTLAAPLAGSIN